ncbi:MFS transporter [Promicromonospora panici]|uniref:MFS transporter n=1 Tax=Promicromonospora panici TaxID=2219658 RepID=UPI00101CF5CD|nr:MFS transporter [Promicromonospora panici]
MHGRPAQPDPEGMYTSTPTTDAPPREPLLTSSFVRLSLADLAYFTAAGVSILALPLYVTGPLGSDAAGAGIAFGAFALSALLLRPVVGRLCDAWGRAPLMIGGGILAATTLALTAHADSLALVVALRLLLGVAEAAFFVASLAALADLAPSSRRGEALSYNSLGLYLGITLGPPLGELLIRTVGFTGAWYGAGVLALGAAAVAGSIGETRPSGPVSDSDTTRRPAWIHRPAIGPGLGFLASVIAMGGFLAFATLRAESIAMPNVSLPLLVYGCVVVVGRVAFARVVDRLPALALGAGSLATIAAGLLLMAGLRTPLALIAGSALMGAGVTFSTPAFFSAIFATATPRERGVASGTASMALDLGLGAGPMVLGLTAAAVGTSWAFGVAAGIAVVGALWTWSLSPRRAGPRHLAPAPAPDLTARRRTPGSPSR